MRLNIRKYALLTICVLLFVSTPALALLDDLLGGGKEENLSEEERKQTIERIETIQEKLKLLQDKLRALERRKAAEKSAADEDTPDDSSSLPKSTNWIPVDEETTEPGEFGLYTYLLFNGDLSDDEAIGALEDFILTTETLAPKEIPPALSNRFLIPVEKAQSSIDLGRRPYDFSLNQAYLRRLDLDWETITKGPVLVSLRNPVDPFAASEVPPFVAVSLGHLDAQRTLELAELWHNHEKSALSDAGHDAADLFWALTDGAGPVSVSHDRGKVLVELPQRKSHVRD